MKLCQSYRPFTLQQVGAAKQHIEVGFYVRIVKLVFSGYCISLQNALMRNQWGTVVLWLESRTGEGSWVRILVEPFRNFGESIYATLPVSFVRPFYLVSTPGEVKYPTQGVNV